MIDDDNEFTPTSHTHTRASLISSNHSRISQTNIKSYFGINDTFSPARLAPTDQHSAPTLPSQSIPTTPDQQVAHHLPPTAYDESTTPKSFIDPIPITPKPSSVLRLYFCNPNGLQLHSTGGELTEFLSQVADVDPDIIGVTEQNLDTTKLHIQLCMKSSIRSVFAKSYLVTSSSTIPSDHDFKPGGTLIAAQANITGRIVTSGVDSFGRWAFLELAGKCHRNVVIMSTIIHHQ
jgi:hypothetical protein